MFKTSETPAKRPALPIFIQVFPFMLAQFECTTDTAAGRPLEAFITYVSMRDHKVPFLCIVVITQANLPVASGSCYAFNVI